MKLNRFNSDSGMVLVMVLLVTIIIMVYAVGVLSRGSSQVVSAESQVDQIKAEQLLIGSYAKAYTDLSIGTVMPASFVEVLDGKTYSISITNSATAGPNGSSTLVVDATLP